MWLLGSPSPGHAGSVSPQVFETVEGPFVAVKDVRDYLHVIEHVDWLAGGPSAAVRANAVILFQAHLNFGCDRFEMRLRRTGTEDKEIGKSGNLPQIEDHDIFRFFVGSEFGAEFREVFGCYLSCSWWICRRRMISSTSGGTR